jgi:methylated-DNA-[protein]-cysteine S-methyltransferase
MKTEKSLTILKLLATVPRGKVTTYGELARATKSSPRAVGQVMRHNKRPDIYPCYKVIASDGNLGGYSGRTSGKNIERKIRMLRQDGVVIKDGRIDLDKYGHVFKNKSSA